MSESLSNLLMSHNHYVDFKIKKEPWNIYKFEDGTLYKSRFILIMAHFEKKTEELIQEMIDSGEKEIKVGTGIGIKHQVLTGVSTPESLMGTPSLNSDIVLSDHIIQEDLDFEPINEPFFEYEFENGFTLKGKVVLMNVDKTDVFDQSGMPVYLVNNTVEAKVKLPPKIKSKIVKKKSKKHD